MVGSRRLDDRGTLVVTARAGFGAMGGVGRAGEWPSFESLLQNGADRRHIQALLGLASLASTQTYLGLDVLDLERMIAKSHPREQGRV